jgi:phosphonate transport system substrate-binding protein
MISLQHGARTTRQWLRWFGFLLLAVGATMTRADCIGDAQAKPMLVVHVAPQFTTTQLFKHWTPFLERVGKSAGLCFELRVAPTIFEFEQALFRGDADLAFLNPYHVVLVQKKQAYVPLVTSGKSQLIGTLLVRRDSRITTFKQLEGQRIAFPAPNAFAATMLTRAALEQQKIKTTPSFVGTHSNVFRAVINGDAAAGGAVLNTLGRESPEVRDMLRILYTSAGFAPHPVAAHPRVPLPVRVKFVEALFQLATDDEGRSMLENVQLPEPIRVTYAHDYKPLESLNLHKFSDVSHP